MDSGANAGCSSEDCEGEEQEDPSSSSFDVIEESDTVTDLNLQNNDKKNSGGEALSAFREQWRSEVESRVAAQDEENNDLEEEPTEDYEFAEAANGVNSVEESGEDELATFRQQWRRELEATPARAGAAPAPRAPARSDPEPASDEERAKALFLKAADLERSGKWYEAIQHYKRAMAIVPDIERRLYETTKGTETPQEEVEAEEEVPVNTNEDDDEEEVVEGEEVVARLLRIQARRGIVCTPDQPLKGAHISCLPYEVLLTVLRWVVSADLDCVSLERVGAACRALHIAARDPDLWRAVCVRTWGMECGTPRAHGFGSWRDMYRLRPRLQLHGCYISKTTYLRHGENSFQDHCYRPWYLVDYYRYLRFFPEGVVLMWTTAEEPAASVHQLRHRAARPGLGIMTGHYRLIGDKVVIVVKKTSSEKKPSQASNTRFRARRAPSEQEHTQTFHVELQLRSVRGRRNGVLAWAGYRVCARRDQWTQFELTARNFPPFAFSRVRAYTQDAGASL